MQLVINKSKLFRIKSLILAEAKREKKDFSCSSNESSEDKNYKMNKNTAGDNESVRKFFAARIFNEGVNITNRSAKYYTSLYGPHTERRSWLMRWAFPIN